MNNNEGTAMDFKGTSSRTNGSPSRLNNFTKRTWLFIAAAALVMFANFQFVFAQTPIAAGYRDFDFGANVLDTPTGEKPESKIWFTDGFWWGSLWSPAANAYTIHKFNLGTQSWTSTGTTIDDRGQSKADALFKNSTNKLYVVSHIYSTIPGPASSGQEARLYRYTYTPATDIYTLDAGFPVNVNSSVSETLVLDRDTTGQLWITWTESGKVKINRTTTDDLTWGTPFDLPGQGTDIDPDDISSLVAFVGNKIGVMWSNRNDQKAYFAVHLDADADLTWQTPEQALADAVLGNVADDHLNLKMAISVSDNLYAVAKTRLAANESPHIFVLQREGTTGVWTKHLVGKVKDGHTRPILAIDDENGKIYVFMMSDVTSDDVIYMKSASFPDPVFHEGTGTPFIQSVTETHISNPSSTKQPLDSNSGLLVIASDQNTHDYFHNYLDLSSGGDPSVDSFIPASGAMGTTVTITGNNFTGATSVNFNGITAGAFTVVSETEIHVNVPDNATTGTITVTTVGGEGESSTNFSVVLSITSFTPTSGFVATEVTVTGNNFGDATAVEFNGVSASGFTIDSENQIRVNVPLGATTGKITVDAIGGSVLSATDFSVTASTTHQFPAAHDTWVRFSGVTNAGSNITFRARTQSSDTSRAYLKFDVTGVSGSILSAKLRLNVSGGSSDGGSLYLVSNNEQGSATPWVESTLIWNIAPTISGTSLGSAGSVDVGQWVEFDVATVITGNGTYSFGLKNSSSDDVLYHSKEATTASIRPELVIQTSGGGPAAPLITSFTPTSGAVGAQVTITGANLSGASDVTFNTTSATTFTVNSATQITATVPTGATTGLISVTTGGGTVQSATNFTVTVPTGPTITSFTPASGIVGSVVTITGTNFTGATDVKFNTTSVTVFTVNSATQITATVPTGATTGLISVTTGGGTGQSATNFTVTIPPAPTISSFTPITGPVGTAVTISGTDFTGASDVKFNTTSATAFTVNSATQITATVPAGATTGKISVTTSGGTVLSGPNFTVTVPSSPPTITSFTPTSGVVSSEVSITGTNFTGATSVQFNGTSAALFTVDSATQIRATVPSGATTGAISVTTAGGTGQSATNFTVSGGGGTFTFAPAHDAYVRQSDATLNFGSQTELRVRKPSASDDLRSFLKFNVTGLTGIVSNAKVRLYVTNASVAGGDVYAVSNNVLSGGTPWTESTLTWSNAPAISGTALSIAGAVTLGQTVEFTVTSAIIGDGTYSFGIKTNSTNDVYYASKEDAVNPIPELVIETIPTPPPTISSFTPSSGVVGASVTITGSNYTGNSVVNFNGVTATTVTINSATQITATVPVGATTGKISVINDGGTGQSATDFTVGPGVSSFSPASGPEGSEVTITGANFTGATAVQFNGLAASTYTVDSATQIRAIVPTGASTGKISVTTPAGTALSANDFSLTPSITSFTPASAVAGTEITITGAHFTGVTAVQFNVTTAAFIVDNATQIRAVVPGAATTGKISVTNIGGSAQSAADFTVLPPAPVITSFTPTSGPVGTVVTITGTTFTGATSVQFNGTAASTFTVNSATQIVATVPNGATTGKISVTTLGGTGLSATDFTVIGPSIASFSPSGALVGAEVTITGSNFTGATNVKFNTTSATTVTVDSDTQIRANVPAGATTGKLSVTTGGGTGLSATDFTVIPPAPVVTSFTPTTGAPGIEVTILGNNFSGASNVAFNGVAATTYTIDSATQIRATIPAGATTGKIGVTTLGGTGLSTNDFIVVPVVTSFTPASGVVGLQVTITGSNFVAASNVQFNGVSAFFIVDSATQIRANVPSGATTGKISVANVAGTGLSATDFIMSPLISSFTPSSGQAGAVVTITGSHFTGATSVQFNGTAAASFTVNSATQIQATVPAVATTGKISVTTAGGSVQSANDFTVSSPVISSFTPTSALVGVEIIFTGSNFSGASSVTFNGTAATTFTVDTPTQIRANVPAGASTGKIGVTTGGGTGLSASDFVVIPPTPIVSSFSPTLGASGTEVTITGSNLAGASSVQFNGVEASSFILDSGTQIRAMVPAGAITGIISVTTLGGTGQSSTNFTAQPFVSSFTPTSGLAGNEVTVTGNNFIGTNSVKFNGTSAFFLIDTATQIRATVPAGATAGKISVTSLAGTGTSAADFTYIPPAPTISSFTPASGLVGSEVTVTGTNFTLVSSVKFNGVDATGFTVDSQTQLRGTVPAGATSGKIGITTLGGTILSATDYTITSPVITAFSPTSGLVGAQITITGVNFTGASDVKFNTTSASTFTVDSATQIRANVPAGASTGKISATTGGGTALSANDFTVIPPPPTISSFTPTSGQTGVEVTITGTNFVSVSSVQFNGTAATTFTVVSATQIKAGVPAAATAGKISVVTLGGTAQSSSDFFVTPVITSFTPSNGSVGTEVTITGNNFTGATSVKFNGVSGFFLVDSSTQVRATVPAGATAGKISVTTAGGTGLSATDFTLAPLISSFTPASGVAGTEVTITGNHFTGVTAVQFNGTPASTFTVDSATQLRATIPTGASTGKISVTNAAATALSATDFTILSPGITSFTPVSGLVGIQVTITGNNLSGALSVAFNGEAATTFAVDSPTQIRATVPATATTGKISVTTGGGTAQSATDFTVIPPAPVISSFSPASGMIGSEVTVTGSHFAGATSVKFNGVLASTYTVDSATQIRASVPTDATTGKISVTTGGGAVISVGDYTVLPAVISFTPGIGVVGIEVTITGSSFAGATNVKFNGVGALFIADTDTQIRANVPAAATTGKISVTTIAGTALSATDFAMVPTLTSFTPIIGAVGTEVTITGTHFNGSTDVKFNGVSASTFTVDSNTSIRANVPAGATTGKISVTAPGGVVQSANNFSMIPTIASFTPAFGFVGNEVTITGEHFTGATGAMFNGTSATTFTVDSNTQIRANVPTEATTGKISVTTAGGTALSADDFIMTPIIALFTPTSGVAGTEVTITGSHFTGATAAQFNGVAAATYTVDSATQIRATAPANATTGKISVTTAGGTALSAADFTMSSPSITSFTPASGLVGAEVTITGANFNGASSVQFNGTAATTFTVDSNTQIRANIPTGATTGKISVTTGGGTAISADDFIMTPVITSFTPTSGLVGDEVTLTGGHFIGASSVKFHDGTATTVTVDSNTQIRATVPATAATGKISVTTAGGTALSATDFTIQSPTITSFTPTSASEGAEVTITGTNFSGASSVKFNGAAATVFTVDSPTQVRANPPSGASSGKIAVTTPGGEALSADNFIVTPAITSFAPSSGLVGTEVTITGTTLTIITSVKFNGVAAFFHLDSATQIRATVPAAATSGKISVTSVDGTALSAIDFTVIPPSPAITSFTPTTGFVGTEVTIAGNNFTGASSVKFNGTDASSFTVDSATQIRATIAAGTTTGKISITTGGGTAESANDFIMTAVIASFTPVSGVVGTEVTITGSHFTGATAVKFNTVLASTFTVDSATQIRATVAPGMSTGKVSVTTAGGEALSVSDFTILPPSIVSFTPFSGVIGAEVTITGNNFTGATGVQFNGTSASTFTVDSNTQIRANVPAGATTGKISVITGGGTAQSATNFGVLPAITSFSPSNALVGTEITITGSHFSGATSVKFNGAGALFIVDSFSQIRANVPAAASNGKISVTTTGGIGLSTTDFLVVLSPPTLTSFIPTSGLVGSEVTITGSNYSNVTEILFNATSAATFTIDTPATIRVTVPAGATNGKIRVTTLGGTILSAGDFTVIPPDPTIASFTPASGAVGTEVTLTGANYTSVTSVQFNGTAASTFTVDSPTQIRANVPSGATSGKISVTTTGGTVLSANNFLMLPIFTSFTPTSGLAGTEVTITGNHFSGATEVHFNGTPGTFTVDSNMQIRANVPANATSGKISVITPADVVFSANDFTVLSPAISSFSPAGALVGAEVTITGSNLSGASSFLFNGLAAASYIVDSATQIRATVPAGATSGKISVTTGGGTALSANDFTVIPPAPVITSFTPSTGAEGSEVTITGSNFTGASDVKFGGVSATTFTVDSATQIRANVAAGAVTGKISVTTLGGTALSANDFTVPPVITAFSPASGLVATEITITGANFTGITSVKINGTAAAYLVDSSTQIRANVPSGSTTGKLSVTNSIGTGLSVNDFTVIPPTPIVSSFTPASSLTGVEITITGNHFLNASSVKFNTTPATIFTVDSNTQIRATVPNGATTGKISVTTTGGTGLSAANFTVIPVGPAISSFTPLIGAVGTQVTITGVNFIGATAVQFNGTAATTFTVDSDVQVRVNVPSGATTGKIGVTGPGGTGLSADDFTMTPIITSFTPASGIASVEVTITGSHYTGATAVQFNGTAASTFTVDSATQIRATLPASATSGKISVTTAGGIGQSANNFTVLAPTIASFSPTSSLVEVEVTITGSSFTGASNVSFNGTAAVYTVDSATQIRATVPAAATTGKISVTTGGGTVLSSNNFTVIPPAPVLTSFTPASGPTGLEITVAGNNFTGASSVQFNGSAATIFTVDSNTQIRAQVPASGTTGKISVTTAGGTAQSANDFTVSSPSIASFSPLIGLIGSDVTITGGSFSGATSVKFNGTSAISFTVDSPTQISATVPAGATTGKISVTTSGGTATSADDFIITTGVTATTMSLPMYDAYVRLATPTSNYGNVTSLRLREGSGDKLNSYLKFDVSGVAGPIVSAKLRLKVTEASVNGGSVHSVSNNYNGTATPWTQSVINWNNAPAISGSPLSSMSAVSLGTIVEFDVTAAVSGNGIVSFGMTSTSSDMAQYSPQEGVTKPELVVEYGTGALPVPTISSFTPTSGGIGVEVTINGANFVGASSVKFNGVSATIFTVNSATQIHANVPIGATIGAISVTTGGGTATSGANFTVTTPPTTPTISSFTPTSGVSGTEVTVTGTNFTGATDVKFNTTSASTFTVDTATQLRVTVPASATTGKISVTTPNGTGLSVTDFTFIPPAPSATSFTPTSGVVGAQVTITGTNFIGVSNVKFNTTTAPTFTVDSATQLRANVPAGATIGKISVTTPGGTALSATDFTVTIPPAPSITSFTPTSGLAGTEVTIIGTELTGASSVQFNSMSASTFTVDSNTQIRATVPAGATTGQISLATGGGTANSVNDFTITAGVGTFTERHVPLYDAYVRLSTPTSNYGTVTGIRLRKSGGDDLDSYLKFVVANINGPVVSAKLRLSVTNASVDAGSVYAVSNSYKNSTTAWTQTGLNWNNAPVISGSPLSALGPVSIGQIAEFDVTAAISGNGTYSFGLTNNSSDDVHYSSQEGAVKPELLVEYSTGAPAAPTISSFLPTSGPGGTEVTVIGANFSGASSVKFNGVSASNFAVDSATQIRVLVPVASTGKISVTTAAGTGTSAADFTVTTPPAPPTIASFTPTSGVVGAQVTIIGTNFTGATSVQFNATVAGTFTVDSATQIRANVPSGATTGKISVTAPGGTAQSAADFTVTGGGTVTLTFNPGEDSYAQLTTPTTNYGSSSGIRAKKTGTEEQRAYLKFSLSGLTGTVVSATLRLKVTNASPDGGSVYKVSNNYVSTSTPWNEDDINWSNAPAVTGSPLSSVGAVSIGNVAEFNVTSAITGNNQISFAITNNSSNDVQFNSGEGAVDPELVIVISSPSAAREDGFADSPAEALPTEFSLSQNYPNPFNARTTIEYALPEAVQVRLAIYNSLGQMVRKLVDETQSAGYKSATWDGTDEHGRAVGSGLYFYRMDAASHRMNGRMILQQ